MKITWLQLCPLLPSVPKLKILLTGLEKYIKEKTIGDDAT